MLADSVLLMFTDGDNDLTNEKAGRASKGDTSNVEGTGEEAKGMVLPFKPLNLTFAHLWYSVDFPKVSSGILVLSMRSKLGSMRWPLSQSLTSAPQAADPLWRIFFCMPTGS